ncbi:hypothetical protein N665_0023s0033 [Sinapis alba]|nr:hypothetical protein N665_0023s0033 [Sinapis alba]
MHPPLAPTDTTALSTDHCYNFRQHQPFVKTSPRKLEPQGTPFTLDSGEACIKIPNSVIEKNKKSWDSFILGQFYEEPPVRGAVHAIVNGIWTKQRRDISVLKMDGHAFLFQVSCPNARRRILSQCLWQVDGQTMFVAKWAPGVRPEKPELSTVQVCLDFIGVPLQFFNRDALKEIAGLVGHPLRLHPSTENFTNIEVAKVYTVIDPRKPLPEAVNAQFESGEVVRITVSSPWLPSLCGHCRKVGHTFSKFPNAPPKCEVCGSVKHHASVCTRTRSGLRKEKAPIANQLPIIDLPPASVSARRPSESRKISPSSSHLSAAKEADSPFHHISDHTMHKQDSSTLVLAPVQNSPLLVDLIGAGISHTEPLPQGSASDSDSGFESISADEDYPSDGVGRFSRVITKSMRKRSARKARARGPLNL